MIKSIDTKVALSGMASGGLCLITRLMLVAGCFLALSGCGGAPDFVATHKHCAEFYKEQKAALDANRFDEADFKVRRDAFEVQLREIEHERKGNLDMTAEEMAVFKELAIATKRFQDRWLEFVNERNRSDAASNDQTTPSGDNP